MSAATVLVLNCGSSSLKCQLLAMPVGRPLAQALVERVGQGGATLTFSRPEGEQRRESPDCPDHAAAIGRVLELLHDPETGPEPPAIEAVGHRVVHAGEAFTGSVEATPEVIAALEACSDLAPLHNPPNLAGIRACLAALPGVPQVCVFDTAFHAALPPEVYLYGLPRRYHQEHRVRRYGFHGVAMRSILGQVVQQLGRPAEELRAVLLMLGSGCTACAVDHGRSVAVSTGFTPLEGLVQGTRCGDLDAGVVLDLLRLGRSPAEVNDLLNRESGLKGVSGVAPDMRDILAADTPRARLAVDLFVHRLIKYVGAYTADLGGLDVLAFGGGIGENDAALRERVAERLGHLGVRLETDRNRACLKGRGGLVSADDSAVKVVVAPVDEELVIASDTHKIVAERRLAAVATAAGATGTPR